MPVIPPTVVVTFYENLHFEVEDVSRVISKLEGGVGFDEETGDFYLIGHMKVIATAGTWKITYKFQTIQQGETGPISFNASAGAVEAALEATEWGEWDVTEVGPMEYLVKMWARDGASFAVSPGMGGASIDLSGVEEEVAHYDKTEYEVPLEERIFGGVEVPVSEVEPIAATAAPKKTRVRKGNQHATGAEVQGGEGESPFVPPFDGDA